MLHGLEKKPGGIRLHVNENKTEYVCFTWEGAFSTLTYEISRKDHVPGQQSHQLKVILTYTKWKSELLLIGYRS